jgi:hypothetical protein
VARSALTQHNKKPASAGFFLNGRVIHDVIFPVPHLGLFHRNMAHGDTFAVHRRFEPVSRVPVGSLPSASRR